MTRQEFINTLALLNDNEFNELVQIYKSGGKKVKYEETTLDFPTYKDFEEYLKDTNRLSDDYDYEAFYNDNTYTVDPKETNGVQGLTPFRWWVLQEQVTPGEAHMPSRYKKPNHMTYGDNWVKVGNTWHFTVPEDKLKKYSFEDYVEYWKANEPNSILHYRNQIYPTSIYKEGGVLENVNLEQLAEELKEHEEPIYKQIKLHKEGGSIISQLIEQLEDSEVVDLLKEFNLDDLISGGIKKGHNISVEIVIEKSCKPLTKIEIGDCQFLVEVVTTDEEMEKGLSNRESLDDDKGMLFDFGEVQDEVVFNMQDCSIPLDIIFINEDNEVISIAKGEPNSEDLYTEKDVRYVLEVNQDSGVEVGDDLELDCDVMKVLAPDGSTQAILKGGERIYSRKATKKLLHWAKRCNKTKTDADYKRLGMIMLNEIDAQDNRQPEYVSLPENK